MHRWIFLALLGAALPGQQDQAAPALGKQQVASDFRLFRKALTDAHPGVYRYTTKAVFDVAFEKARTRIGEVRDEPGFFRLLAPLVALVKCGHHRLQHLVRPTHDLPIASRRSRTSRSHVDTVGLTSSSVATPSNVAFAFPK